MGLPGSVCLFSSTNRLLYSSSTLSVYKETEGGIQASKMADQRMSARRKHNIKGCMLTVAMDMLGEEATRKAEERESFLSEKCPPIQLPHSRDELLAMVKQLNEQVNAGEEEKYGIEFKLNLVINEVRDLNIKIVDLRGKFKKPKLKKVRMSADAMLKALLGSNAIARLHSSRLFVMLAAHCARHRRLPPWRDTQASTSSTARTPLWRLVTQVSRKRIVLMVAQSIHHSSLSSPCCMWGVIHASNLWRLAIMELGQGMVWSKVQ